MARRLVSERKASAAYLSLFLIGLALLIWFDYWWPGIAMVLGISIAARQFLLGKHYDAWVSVAVFGGLTVLSVINIQWDIILPILLLVGGIYIFFRDFLDKETESEIDHEEDITIEIEEENEKKKKK